MSIVGIIANPSAGKDIRRVVAHGRTVPDIEKVNIIKRVLLGLDAAGVNQVLLMPDRSMLGKSALRSLCLRTNVRFLDTVVLGEESDSTRAARKMVSMGVGCLVTLGGDGTNRAVALGSGKVPIVPIALGTNNVFSINVEGTLAGLAAGVVARDVIEQKKTVTSTRKLEVQIGNSNSDIALVDVAISKEMSIGSRAIWDVETLEEVFLAKFEVDSTGLSSIGAAVNPTNNDFNRGLHIKIGHGGFYVVAPVAPGLVSKIPILNWSYTRVDQAIAIGLTPSTIALDGERSYRILEGQTASVTLKENGPPVVSVNSAIRHAYSSGILSNSTINTIGNTLQT